ncbi:MAG: hypothetical protein WCJ02_00380 [bacterium]
MMQKFFTKYWLAFQLLILFGAVSVGIFSKETNGSIYLFWLSLFAVESLVLLPTVFKDEAITEARKRVLRSMEGDSFTYVGIVLMGIVCIQWLNSGCSLVYLTDADVWKFSLPPVEWLPYSVKPIPALAVLSLVVSVFAGGLVIRNGLGKGGKRFFLEAATIMSGMIAAYAVLQSLKGVPLYAAWATDPGACNPGTFFAFWFLISLGRDLSSASSKFTPVKTALWWGFAFAGNLVGFLQFSSALGLLIYGVIGVLLIIYRISILFCQHVQVIKRFRFVLGIGLAVSLVTFAIVFLVPKSPIIPKIMELTDTASFEQAIANRNFRMKAALKIWEGVPWTGVGANGFSQYLGTVIEDSDWKQAKKDKQFVWSDAYQFLCEWGVIGSGVLIAMIITMLIPLFVRMRNILGNRDKSFSVWGDFLEFDDYVVPCLVVIVVLLIEGWFSSPFQSPAIFMSWFCVLAVLPGLLPAPKRRHF